MDEELFVTGNKELLSLVWNNLLSNAFKFTEEGGSVKVIAGKTGEKVFVYQGDTSHATKGNGLGLALVKRVIDICGAQISVKSILGKGTAFTVLF